MKLPYWIQRADFSTQDFKPIDVIEAEKVLMEHDWESERALQTSLENQGKALHDDFCPPNVGFVREEFVLQFCPNEDRTANCNLIVPASPFAVSKGERYENVLIVTDTDAVRTIDNATRLLQFRLLQLHFRPDQDALEYLFDEYVAPKQ